MKILVLNGSPRKGNTLTAIKALTDHVSSEHEVEIVNTYELKVGPCKGCGACQCKNGCVDKDDSNMVVDKIVAADLVVFATPVYWWGMTAQLKLVLDKCYCRGSYLTKKNAGLIVIGGDKVEHRQYRLIKEQFDCIQDYLGWNFLFQKSYSASGKTDLAGDKAAMDELAGIGKSL